MSRAIRDIMIRATFKIVALLPVFTVLERPCLANMDTLERGFQVIHERLRRQVNETDAEHARANSANKLRHFGGNTDGSTPGQLNFMIAAINPIVNYGCWCFFEDDHGQGRGRPVNRVDEICKVMHDGYECATIEEDGCVPWDVAYTPIIGVVGMQQETPEEIHASCTAINTGTDGVVNTCGAKACAIETYFLDTLLQHIMFNRVDESFQHVNGFNSETECVALETTIPPYVTPNGDVGAPGGNGGFGNGGGHGDGDNSVDFARQPDAKQCCGEYPVIFPYRKLHGARDCCINKTYNTQLLTCCPDGELRSDSVCS